MIKDTCLNLKINVVMYHSHIKELIVKYQFLKKLILTGNNYLIVISFYNILNNI